MQLKGKTVLISGAGRNNGKAIALAFARAGADLILVSRRLGDELNQVARDCEALGAQTLPLLADVGVPEQVNRVVQSGLERYSKIDVLVCVAGIRPHKPFWEYGYDEWQQVFAVNVHSAFYLAKAVAPGMMQRRSGNIIALGSVASVTAVPNGAVEVASKHGLYGLIKSLALELGPYGIRANLLGLSFIANERQNPEWYPATGGKHSKAQIDSTALKRAGTREEVANAALFLASDQSSYVTGDRMLCAGGRYM